MKRCLHSVVCALFLLTSFGIRAQSAIEEPDIPRTEAEADADIDAAPDAGMQREIDAETEQKIRRFLDRFVDAQKTPSEQAALFADEVDYYDRGIVDKQEILRDVQRFVRHWTHRYYEVSDISYMQADPDSDRVFVAYTIEYEVANRSRSINGKASYGVVIANLDSTPQVESIKERVTASRYSSGR